LIGVQKGGTGATATFDTAEHHAGDTILLVGKYDFTVSPNRVSLWVNPDQSTFGASEPATGFVSATAGTYGFTIDRFNMRQNTAASVPAAMQWDELRIGVPWWAVTPLAPPTFVTLTDFKQLANGAFQFAYTNSGGQSATVYASTNLADWATLGPATQIAPNLYQFTDATATNFLRRFYKLRPP